MADNFEIVGKSFPRHESIAKVTGQAQYSDDLQIPGMVYGRILRSPYAHARVLQIDKSVAEKVPGMKREKLLDGYKTKAIGADVTSVGCNGQWLTIGIVVDATNGMVLSIDQGVMG